MIATNDEARLKAASIAAAEVLRPNDAMEYELLLRQPVLHAEVTGKVEYDRHRDHTAHTLNNYLLGLIFLKTCPALNTALDEQLRTRGGDDTWFPLMWTHVSLLHDVGYVFEGAISRDAPEHPSSGPVRAATALRGLLQARLWEEWKFATREALEIYCSWAAPNATVYLPEGTTLVDIARSLERVAVPECAASHFKDYIDSRGFANAFDLWICHCRPFSAPQTSRIQEARRHFWRHIELGDQQHELRVLNHGVMSALLVLQLSTLYYCLALKTQSTLEHDVPPPCLAEWRRIRGEITAQKIEYLEHVWRNGILWSTAACAIHDLVQTPSGKHGRLPLGAPTSGDSHQQLCDPVSKLCLADDALAYLGVLVDCLQQWDRPRFKRRGTLASVDGRDATHQGIDVFIEERAGKLAFCTSSENLLREWENGMELALEDWRDFVLLEKSGTMSA